ncbi:MAG: TRAP transporter large permease [Synergistetes bacterium]|nr:TRAP transporter large permease [Synergistota bacterium]
MEYSGILILGVFLLLLFSGVSIAATLMLTSVFYLVIRGEAFALAMMVQRLFEGVNRFELIAIPLFILSGDLLYEGKISGALVEFVKSFMWRGRGSLPLITTISCMLFGALSGSGPATASAIGATVAPAMEEEGYPREFTASVISASGPLGILIPPSILLLVYGAVTDTSVAKLFLAGIVPGILYGTLLIVYEWYVSVKNGYGAITEKRKSFSKAFKEASWALGAPFIILGGIYGGIFTPTEAAVVAVVYAYLIGKCVYRTLEWSKTKQIILKSTITSATVLFIIAGVSCFGWILAREKIPQLLTLFAIKHIESGTLFLILSNIIILIAGMFENGSAVIILLAPLLEPIALRYGIDPVFYGALMTANLAIGMCTPPVAVTLYVAARICNVPFDSVAKRILPFIGVLLIGLFILTFFPGLTMYIPNLIMK